MRKMHAVEIHWEDACSTNGVEKLDKREDDLVTLENVGWLINETKEIVVIAAEIDPIEPRTCRHTITIPKSNIVLRRRLYRRGERGK